MIDACLERRYDGPVPPSDPARDATDRPGRARLFARLCREAGAEAAGRRQRLAAAQAAADHRLRCLVDDLGRYRASGLGFLIR